MKKSILGLIVVGIIVIVVGVFALTNKGVQSDVSPESPTPPTTEQAGGQASASQMSDEDVKVTDNAYTDLLSKIADELGYTLEVLEEKIETHDLTEKELKKCAALGLAIAW